MSDPFGLLIMWLVIFFGGSAAVTLICFAIIRMFGGKF